MTPDIYYFNPTCELSIANGSASFMASAQLRRFENELSTLFGILARSEDIVLVDKVPAKHYTDHLKRAGFDLPAFRVTEHIMSDPSFLSFKKGFLFPWGWSPSTHKRLLPFKQGCCSGFLNSPVAEWRPIHRELFSRKTSLAILHHIVERNISNNILSLNYLPEICTSHGQIISLQRKWGKVVVKAPWSASGRGLQILRKDEYNQTNKQVIEGYFRQQGYVVAGPWHDKVLDLSFQFFSHGNGRIEYRGLTSFSTDQAGRYLGNYLQELPPDIQPEVAEFLRENIPEVLHSLHQILITSSYSTDYYGWLGVDALIFKSREGKLKFHPCLEINCRFTMGAIALSLRSHLAEQSTGEFRIIQVKEGHFPQLCEEMIKKEPLVVEKGKVVKGFLPVTPLVDNCRFGAYIIVYSNQIVKE